MHKSKSSIIPLARDASRRLVTSAVGEQAAVAACERCTPVEACEYLRISRQTLRRYTADGRIAVHRFSSQKLIYHKSDLDRFLDTMKVEAA